MSVNQKKTKMLMYSRIRKYHFTPELKLGGSENIEIVEELKKNGFILRSDLRTNTNTKSIVKKAYSRMSIIRTLKALWGYQTPSTTAERFNTLSACMGLHAN